MPEGYWSAAGLAIMAGPFVATVVITLAYWLNVPVDGYTIFMPLFATFNTGLTAAIAGFVASIGGMIANAVWPAGAIWVATGIFVLAVFAIIGSANPATAEIDRALGSFRFIVPSLLAGAWVILVTRPV